MKSPRLIFNILFAVLLCLMLIPTHAQDKDSTPDAAPVAVATQSVDAPTGDVTVNVQGDAAPATPVEAPAATSLLDTILKLIVGAVIGAVSALASAAAWIKSAMNDPVKMTLAEQVGKSIPESAWKELMEFQRQALRFTAEVSDGVPMVTKPTLSTEGAGASSASVGDFPDGRGVNRES